MEQFQESQETITELTEEATVVVVTYNHAEFIDDCLETALAEKPAEIIVVDSGSTDGTKSIVKDEFPEVALRTPDENLGYGAGNNAGVREIDTKYTVILNPDTKVENRCFDSLLRPLSKHTHLITTPKILTYDGSRINTCGNTDHFTGLGFTRGLHQPPTEHSEQELVSGISGACFALRTELYRELGGFDESFFLYMEDVELSWRAALNGVDILYVPDAVIYHDFEDVSVPAGKLYHVERGRYYTLRKHYNTKMAFLLLPSLIVTELLTTGYAAMNGVSGIKNKFRAIKDGLSMDVKDIEKNPRIVLVQLAATIPKDQLTYGTLDQFGKKLANAVYRFNYSLVNA